MTTDSVLGTCLKDEWFDADGDAQQQTTGGILRWRKVDNWTPFTDSEPTWVTTPTGVQRQPRPENTPIRARLMRGIAVNAKTRVA